MVPVRWRCSGVNGCYSPCKVRYLGPPESMVYDGDRPVVTRIEKSMVTQSLGAMVASFLMVGCRSFLSYSGRLSGASTGCCLLTFHADQMFTCGVQDGYGFMSRGAAHGNLVPIKCLLY